MVQSPSESYNVFGGQVFVKSHITAMTTERISPHFLADYLVSYTSAYRSEYSRLVAAGVVPDIVSTPFSSGRRVEALLATDGVIVPQTSNGPASQWEIAGGPAFLIDTEPTTTPKYVFELLKASGLVGKNIGIYRIVKTGHVSEHWRGILPKPVTTVKVDNAEGFSAVVKDFPMPVGELLARLTLGFTTIIDIHLETLATTIWRPVVIRHAGFVTGDRKHKRFYEYLAIHPHADRAAWDERAVWARASIDVRRDIRSAIGQLANPGSASIDFPTKDFPDLFVDHEANFKKRVTSFEGTIIQLEKLLDDDTSQDESVYHEHLRKNPELLDFYAVRCVSKPKWYYKGHSNPLNKEYVEPDFVLCYPSKTYRLVELERPDHQFTTKKGQPTAAAHTPFFQLAEWRSYISTHYDAIKDEFPGISPNGPGVVIISRTREQAFHKRDVREYLSLLSHQHHNIECWTYDDVVTRARTVLNRLASL
jgi:hypothetical protein